MTNRTSQRQEIARARVAQFAAEDLARLLAALDDDDEELKVVVADEAIVVPKKAAEQLIELLEALGNGQDPTVLPTDKELSTGEAAELLGVSRQYMVRLLDEGRLPCRREGNRRRIRASEAVRYLRNDDRRRRRRFRELTNERPEDIKQ